MTNTVMEFALSLSPRGLSRSDAAEFIGVGTTKFDELVADGRMPKPKRVDGRTIWDRLELEAAFEALPTEAARNPWDEGLHDRSA